MADFNFKGYDNFVLQEYIDSILATKLDVNKFLTVDNTLTANPGMIVKVHRYTGTGDVDDLGRGEGNTNFIDAEYAEQNYVVKRTQGTAKYYDDDLYADPKLVDAKLKYLAEGMINDWTKKAIAEMAKTRTTVTVTGFTLGDFADIIAGYANKYEDQTGLFFLINQESVPAVRKALGEYLKYTEAYIRTGALGDILGVPLYASKAAPKGVVICATNEAVTAFLKKNTSVETDRDIDNKLNSVVADRYAVIALTDETKCIEGGLAQTTALTAAADVSDGAIAGAATTGALVTAYAADGTELGHATAASSTYSISSSAFKAGDKITVVATLEGYVKQIKECTAVA